MSDFAHWLEGLGLEKYREVFAAQDIDLTVAPELTDEDLEKLGLSLGHRRKFLAAAAKLRQQSAAAPPPAERRRAQVERRQITVVFTDLVDSAGLASRLDPEDMGRLLGTYREASTSVLGKYDGTIAQFLGDGILAYFGYPQAQEDAAERAVRAALELVARIGQLLRPDGRLLQARAGIVTGLVATSETEGAAGEQTVVGNTPNLAARLQALAEPGCVLVGPTTHRLTRHLFDYQHEGEQTIKGFDQPVAVWRALGERSVESRFAAARADGGAPILGRERELAFLADSWERARRGNGHVVLIAGEAGMGKSKLAEAFAARTRDRPTRLVRFQCSPYHRNTALYPIIQLLKQALMIRQAGPAAENLHRIETMLEQIGRSSRVAKILLAELLEVPTQDALSAMEMTPAQRKNETLALLEDFLLASSALAPALVLLEDAHWSDPSTRSLVDRLLQRIGQTHALVLVTHRPELRTSWADHAQATLVSCKPLGADQCASVIRRIATQRSIDDSIVRQIVARSDGVPLFVEELTKAVIDVGSLSSGSVPLSLQDSLAARLDRLGKAREIAQVASVIGRQFSFPLLAAISGMNGADLAEGLDRLQASGLVLDSTVAAESRYSFNHSLIQEAAYESLARDRRQILHAAIAEALSSQADEGDAGLIAFHLSRAGKAEAAFRQWMLAAERSSKRSAYAESLANLTSALEDAERIAQADLRMQLTLEAQSQLAAIHVIHDGPASPAAESSLAKAYAVARQANSGPKLFQAVWGLYLNAATKFDFDTARARGEELTAISRTLSADSNLHLEALHHSWGIAYFGGHTQQLLDYSRQGIDGYDRACHHALSEVYAGHDPGVCAHGCYAIGLGLAGRAGEVRPAVDGAIHLAEALEHPVTLAFGLGIACHALHLAGDLEGCREFSARMLQVAERYDFVQQGAFASFMLGLVHSGGANLVRGLEQMQAAFEAASTYRFVAGYPHIVMAEALMKAGRNQDALSVITRALDAMKNPERGMFVSELWRLRGELALAISADRASAQHFLSKAVRIAAEQGAKPFHANASRALARLG